MGKDNNVIKMKETFGMSTFVERQQISNCPYNTVIDIPANSQVVIFDSNSRDCRVLLDIEDPILNKHKFGLFENKNKKDPNNYEIYFVDNATISDCWGTNTDMEATNIPELKNEKINIRIEYQFRVVNPRRFIENLTSEGRQNVYNRQQAGNMVKQRIKNTIVQYVTKYLNDKGLAKFHEYNLQLSSKIEEALNSNQLFDLGVEFKLNSVVKEESEEIREIVENVQIKKYIAREAKEIK